MYENMDQDNALGERLRAARKKQFPNDDQKAFALRIGVSINTYNRMEQGYLNVAIKHYREAARVLQLQGPFDELFTLTPSLFDA